MIDIGLLATIAIVLIVPTVFVRPWPPEAASGGLIDICLGAAFLGLGVARVSAVALAIRVRSRA